MAVLIFAATLIAGSLVAGLAVAPVMAEPRRLSRLGRARAAMIGLAGSFALAFAIFALGDPDPLGWPETRLDYLQRTFGITVLGAFVWLPAFLGAFSALARRVRA